MFRKKTGRTDEGYIKALFRAPDSMSVDEQASRSLRYHKQRFQPTNSLPLPAKIIKNTQTIPLPKSSQTAPVPTPMTLRIVMAVVS